ncbi:MAG: hypothetical protein GXX86_11015 [Propionibacterium sp.]|nr:hypothetical protein [Propionibacterium sp.]
MTAERNKTAVLTVITGLIGVVTVGVLVARINPWLGAAAAVVALLLLAVVLRALYRTGKHTPWAEARQRVGADHAVVLWKPTCAFCEVLLRSVGDDPRVTWVNVWADPEANAAVRELNDGNELTPTALVGTAVLRNPSRADLLAAVKSTEAP